MSGAYYNELDKDAAQWLRNLIAAGLIADGDVDERSIWDVRPTDVVGYRQCHFFAGVGVWSYALRLAGVPDDAEVWTGSCPCQPFSSAGARRGFADERHAWPAFHYLIEQCRPGLIYGEQVASRDGLAWLDAVHADLEAAGYAVGAVDTCAAGFGAPHIRQRLYWVADSGCGSVRGERCDVVAASRRTQGEAREQRVLAYVGHGRDAGRLTDDDAHGRGQQRAAWVHGGNGAPGHHADGRGPTGCYWSDADWIACIDGKARPVEPGTFPLADGAPARVVRLRAYGNAIVATQAAEFIRAAA